MQVSTQDNFSELSHYFSPGQPVDIFATWEDRWLAGFQYLRPSRYEGKVWVQCPRWFGNGESTCDLKYLRPHVVGTSRGYF